MNIVNNWGKAIVGVLNQPIVKTGVKNFSGYAAFSFGLFELYDAVKIIRGRKISSEKPSSFWARVAFKIEMLLAKTSLLCSMAVSKPGREIISAVAEKFFTTAQLEAYFGPNTIFAINPRHPRHIVSIAAVALAAPSILISGLILGIKATNWVYNKVRDRNQTSGFKPEDGQWLTNGKVRLMAIFNTVTSRPVLHLANQFAHSVFKMA